MALGEPKLREETDSRVFVGSTVPPISVALLPARFPRGRTDTPLFHPEKLGLLHVWEMN